MRWNGCCMASDDELGSWAMGGGAPREKATGLLALTWTTHATQQRHGYRAHLPLVRYAVRSGTVTRTPTITIGHAGMPNYAVHFSRPFYRHRSCKPASIDLP